MHRLLSLLLVPACSWALVDKPPGYDTGVRPLPCTTSLASPVADTVLAAGMFAAATAVVMASRSPDTNGQPTGANFGIILVVPAVLAGIPYTFSAIYGYTQTHRCRRMNHQKPPPPPPQWQPGAPGTSD